MRDNLKSYLCDAVEAAHERIKRVEQTQKVVQFPDQSEVIITKQVAQRGGHHTHLKHEK